MEQKISGKLYTVAEVKAILRVSDETVYRYIKNGDLPAIKVGNGARLWRIPEEALNKILNIAKGEKEIENG